MSKTEASKQKTKGVDLASKHQRSVARVLLMLVIPAGMLFGVIDMLRQSYFISAVNFSFSLVALIVWRVVEDTKYVQRILIGFSFPIFFVVLYVLTLPNTSSTTIMWIFLVPVLSYPALGVVSGMYATGFFYAAIYSFFYYNFGHLEMYQLADAVSNIVVCSLAVWGFVHASEKGRSYSQLKLSDLAITDPLTGLKNRLSLDDSFEQRKGDSHAAGLTLGLIMLDLDFFKSVNDEHGHLGGDLVLCQVADALRASVRSDDQVFRLGGEEFCLFVGSASQKNLVRAAEAIRTRIESLEMRFEDQSISVTASLGVVMHSDTHATLDSMLARADAHLYEAKNKGRNRVVFSDRGELVVA
mgnify:CR=1 FL=1